MSNHTTEMDDSRTLVQRMADHDANEERRYLTDTYRRRTHLCWSWLWLSWGFGLFASVDPDGDPWAVTLVLGPLSVEVYREEARHG